jgi:ABC-type lipoprotein export system ATPase subunit
MVTHNPEYLRYATRTVTMRDGKIAEGAPEEHAQHEERRAAVA